jgi:hypothetical protein
LVGELAVRASLFERRYESAHAFVNVQLLTKDSSHHRAFHTPLNCISLTARSIAYCMSCIPPQEETLREPNRDGPHNDDSHTYRSERTSAQYKRYACRRGTEGVPYWTRNTSGKGGSKSHTSQHQGSATISIRASESYHLATGDSSAPEDLRPHQAAIAQSHTLRPSTHSPLHSAD